MKPKYSLSDVALILAEKFDVSPRNAELYIISIVNAMREEIEEKNRIEIRGFGVFKMKNYCKPYRNPKTGETFDKRESRVLKFQPSKVVYQRYTSAMEKGFSSIR